MSVGPVNDGGNTDKTKGAEGGTEGEKICGRMTHLAKSQGPKYGEY